MLTTTEKKFSIVYALIVLASLICADTPSLATYNYIAKPSIVISLLVFFWMQSQSLSQPLRLYIAMALLFSVIGDSLLLFVERSPNYFLLGLISFLIAHILYVVAFLRHRNTSRKPYGFVFGLLLYAMGLFYVLKDGLQEMLIPVIVYMLIILSMATAAFLRKGKVSRLSYRLVFTGAIFFMISDSLLALNKFYEVFAYENISIMVTYALAQYLIVLGLLKLDNPLN